VHRLSRSRTRRTGDPVRVLSLSKKPFAANPWLRVCEGSTLVGFLLTLNLMSYTTGLSFALFIIVGVPLLLLSAAITVVLFIHDLRKRYSLFGLEQFEPGELIFREGDLADRVYFVVKGTVEVVRTLEGKEIILARLGPGDFFGEMAFFTSEGRRNATVRSSTQVELHVLGKENFARLIQAIPAAQKEFSAKAVERLKERER